MSTAKNCIPATANKAKSSFAMTCNRLSFFLKEKGSLRDLQIHQNFDLIGNSETSSPATTVDLLKNIDRSYNNHLPQYVSVESFCKPDESIATTKSGSGEPIAATETKTAQMTIFYGGEVLVFDYISADKARDLMLAASNASSSDNQIASTSMSPSGSQPQVLQGVELNGSDLPIARRASLHRFLAKRKDRATVRAPYQLHNNPLMASSSASNQKFDLNL